MFYEFLFREDYFQMELTTIEIDPVMKYIAKKWFHVKENDKQKIIIEDGVNYILKNDKSEFHINH